MRINQILHEDLEEGRAAKIAGGVALLAALLGIDYRMAQKEFAADPQLQQLISHLQTAKEKNDVENIEQLKKRIKMQKDRVRVGKGPVRGHDGLPIVPEYDRPYRASQD